MCMCFCSWLYICAPGIPRCPWKPEEGVEFSETDIAGSCDLLDMDSGNQTEILYKNNNCFLLTAGQSFQLHLSVSGFLWEVQGVDFSQTSQCVVWDCRDSVCPDEERLFQASCKFHLHTWGVAASPFSLLSHCHSALYFLYLQV